MNINQTTSVDTEKNVDVQTETKSQVSVKRKPYRSQLVNRGDVSHGRNSEEVRDIVTDDTTEAADMHEVAALETILKGEAPMDRIRLLRIMLKQEKINIAEPSEETDPDDVLVKDWRTGVYPYRNRLSRKAYEKEKFKLQVELLKLQSWVKETGQKIIIIFEGRDAAGKGGIQRIAGTAALEQAAPAAEKFAEGFFPGLQFRITG